MFCLCRFGQGDFGAAVVLRWEALHGGNPGGSGSAGRRARHVTTSNVDSTASQYKRPSLTSGSTYCFHRGGHEGSGDPDPAIQESEKA